MSQAVNILVVYDRIQSKLLGEATFDDSDIALKYRFSLEPQYSAYPEVEIMVLSGPSREVIQRNHRRYWASAVSAG
jgi:hypothetical protein